MMRFCRRNLFAVAVGVLLVVSGALLAPAASAAAPPAVTTANAAAAVSLSSPAARARGVTYTVRFTPSAAVKAGTGKLTLTAPKGTVLPSAIGDVYDLTAGQDLGAFTGGKLSASGATATWTVAATIPAGHLVQLTLNGVTNPPAGTYSLAIATSSQAAIKTAAYRVTPPGAVRSPVVSFPAPVSEYSTSVTFPVQFTTSPTGTLEAGHGTITLTAPKGTILPYSIADVYDVTAGADLGPLPGGVLSGNGAVGTWTVATTIPAGHVIDLRLDGVTDPAAAGTYQLAIVTSSDTVPAKASYAIVNPSKVPQLSGTAGSGLGDGYLEGAIIQACPSTGTGCLVAPDPSGYKGDWEMTLPAPGEYTLTAYPPAADAGSLAPDTIGPEYFGAGGEEGAVFYLPSLTPSSSGVSFGGQSATVPTAYWSSPDALSAPGCQSGTGVAVVSSVNPATGTPDVEIGRLAESPAGSGTYTATVPPLYPAHGAATVSARTACSPQTALLPSSGPAQGGTGVQLTGTGFTGATAVLFGDKRAESFTVASGTEIDAVAPAGSGTVQVSVVTPDGTITSATLAGYTYLSVGSIYPAGGQAGGGTAVTITGSGFSGLQALYFGSKQAGHVDVVSNTEVTATVPAGKPGTTVPVTILTSAGQSAAGSATFTYWNPSAAARPAASGGRTTTATASPAIPRGRAQTSAAAAPAGTAGAFEPANQFAQQLGVAGDIVKDMESSCASAGVGATMTNALNGALASVSSDLGQPQGWLGLAEGVTGPAAAFLSAQLQSTENFAALQPFTDGGLSLPEMVAAGTLVSALNGLARHGASVDDLQADLSCAAASLSSLQASSPVTFSVNVIPSGTVVDTSGHPVPGATVTLLQSPIQAQPVSAPAAGSSVMEPSVNPQTSDANGMFGWDTIAGWYQVTAQAPACQAPVSTPVFASPPTKVGLVLTLSCAGEAPPSVPSVTGLSAASGPASGGTQVDVQGTGFTDSATVTFGTRNAVAVTVLSPTELVATAPAGTGTVDVRVAAAAGRSAYTGADKYSYTVAPVVKRITPAAGPAKGGSAVTIAGTGFAPGDQVTFGSALAELVTVASATKIVAVSPPGYGPATVAVSNADGAGKPSAADVFGYLLRPSFTSAVKATATKGKSFSFTVAAVGYPVPAFAWSGKLPGGLRIRVSGRTLVISGKPAATGRFLLSLTARNSQGTAKQTLTITVRS
jgi:IPT/TIG domain